MCTQGIEWNLLYVPQMTKPWTFQELATKVHKIEVIMVTIVATLSVLLSERRMKMNSRGTLSYLGTQQRGDVHLQDWASLDYGKAQIGR